jgi:hypothetical protein
VGHDRPADVPVDSDLGQGRLAQRAPDDVRVPGRGQPQQLLVAVGEMAVLVIGDHPDRPADIRAGAGVSPQRPHLLRRALLGDAAVRQVGDDVAFAQLLVAPQLAVRQPETQILQPHRVIGLGRHRHRIQAPPAQQRSEDAPVLILIGAMPGDLGRQVLARPGHQRCDPAVLPAALRLTAGRDGAEQPERLIVTEDVPEDCPGREHPFPPR